MKAVYTIILLISVLGNCSAQNDELQYRNITPADSFSLASTWEKFVTALGGKNTRDLKELSLRRIYCDLCFSFDASPESYFVPIDTFINQASRELYQSKLWKVIKEGNYTMLVSVFPGTNPEALNLNEVEKLTLYEIHFLTYKPGEWAEGHEGQTHGFQFVKIDDRFRFFGLTSIP